VIFSGRLVHYGLCVGTTGHRLSFSQLVARGKSTPLRGLRGVRNEFSVHFVVSKLLILAYFWGKNLTIFLIKICWHFKICKNS